MSLSDVLLGPFRIFPCRIHGHRISRTDIDRFLEQQKLDTACEKCKTPVYVVPDDENTDSCIIRER